MGHSMRRLALVGLLATSLLLPGLGRWACSQEDRTATPAAGQEANKDRSKPRGRLPLYFSRVVTPEQRDKIYSIQAGYDKQIEDLLAQLRQLEEQRDKEVFEVLTPDQQKQVTALLDEARKRREAGKKGAEEAGGDSGSAPSNGNRTGNR
jgi:hypothetical protein